MHRIRQGYALVRNPFNPAQMTRVDLAPEEVDALFFVTRNPKPLFAYLDELEQMGYRFCFQYTITGYPKFLEPNVETLEAAVRLFRQLSDRIGPDRIIWRFDPIVLSTGTPEAFILGIFEEIAARLKDHTKRVIISFADYYKKVISNFQKIKQKTGISFFDLHGDPQRLYRIAGKIAEIARDRRLEIFSCAEKHDLTSVGIRQGKCIDDEILRRCSGSTCTFQGQESEDILRLRP